MDSIESLLSSVSPEDMEHLKGVAANLLGNSENSVKTQKPESSAQPTDVMGAFGSDMTKALTQVAMRMNQEDERTKFLRALEPLLSPERRKKAEEAIQFLKLMDMMPLLKGFVHL